MKVITKRVKIREVSVRWIEQYGRTLNEKHKLIGEKLNALDVETATPEEVTGIIGNDSWTWIRCDDCREDAEKVVQLGDEPDYDSATANICLPCLQKALKALTENTD